ncbi:MAG: peptidoglycan DD-metalloendopeptidase family protein [Peptococcaceae bacterium]|nr:peptidoglycan DD-metalloendopeptidase family protein [Peptococcaceae bacterium]
MNFTRNIASSLVLSLGITSLVVSPMSAESISDLQDQQASIDASIEQKKSELDTNATQKNATLAKMKEINDSINTTEQKIASFATQITDQEAAIEKTNKEIAATESKLEKAQGDLNDRLVTIYKDGQVNYLDALLQAEDLSDFLTRFEYLSYIAKRDKDLVDSVSETKAQLDNQKATLEQQLNSLNALKTEEESVKSLLQDQQATQESVYAELEKDEDALKENISVMQQTSEEIGDKIVALQKEAEEAAKASEAAKAAKAVSNGKYEIKSAGNGVWPAPESTAVTSSYGGRSHPIGGSYNFHLGTDIAAPYGSPIIAYQAGTVIIAEYHWSYGNYVVIDHGNGFSTLYAHQSALYVKVGDTVAAGQQIGAIGSTGSSTGPHLHFETRINGSVTDAAPYLGI